MRARAGATSILKGCPRSFQLSTLLFLASPTCSHGGVRPPCPGLCEEGANTGVGDAHYMYLQRLWACPGTCPAHHQQSTAADFHAPKLAPARCRRLKHLSTSAKTNAANLLSTYYYYRRSQNVLSKAFDGGIFQSPAGNKAIAAGAPEQCFASAHQRANQQAAKPSFALISSKQRRTQRRVWSFCCGPRPAAQAVAKLFGTRHLENSCLFLAKLEIHRSDIGE